MGFHGWDLVLILVAVVFIFGARRLPEIGAALGKGFQSLQKGLHEQQEEKVSVEEVTEDEQA